MGFSIERDTAPITFWGSKDITLQTNFDWVSLPYAAKYKTEEEAQSIIDTIDVPEAVIIVPNDEVLFEGSSEKSNEVLNGMQPDTQGDNAA